MGVEIEFGRIAYKIDKKDIKKAEKNRLNEKLEKNEITEEEFTEQFELIETKTTREDKYLLLAKHGSNNCVDENGRIVKKWNNIHFGNKIESIKHIIDVSRGFETGMIRYSNGRGKPEGYIKNWRKTINNAKDLEEFFNTFYRIETQIRFVNKSKLKELEEQEKELFQNDEFEKTEDISYDIIYKKPIESLKDILEFYEIKDEMKNKSPVMKIEK